MGQRVKIKRRKDNKAIGYKITKRKKKRVKKRRG